MVRVAAKLSIESCMKGIGIESRRTKTAFAASVREEVVIRAGWALLLGTTHVRRKSQGPTGGKETTLCDMSLCPELMTTGRDTSKRPKS